MYHYIRFHILGALWLIFIILTSKTNDFCVMLDWFLPSSK